MVLGSRLYGGRDFEAGVPSKSLGTAGVSSGSLSGTINLTPSGTPYGFIDHIDIYGIAQSAASGMSTGNGMIFNFTVTVDGVAGSTNIITEFFPFLGTGETSVIKSDRALIPVNARFNSSASIAWTAAVQGSRLQSSYVCSIRVNGQRSN